MSHLKAQVKLQLLISAAGLPKITILRHSSVVCDKDFDLKTTRILIPVDV
jgi:hypothetical protein